MAGPASSVGGSAKWGNATIPDVLKWTVNPKNETQAYASSSTAGWKKRLAGCKDLSGSIDTKVQDTGLLPCKPGDKAILVLKGSAGVSFSGPAIIDDISIETDIDTGAIIGLSINFSADGAWDAF